MSKVERDRFVLDYLMHKTNEENMVSLEALTEACNHSGHKCTRRTIASYLDQLMDQGHDIIVKSEPGKPKYFAYGSRQFEIAELKMMIDAVASSIFISPKKSEQLIAKLAAMAGADTIDELRAAALVKNRVKSDNDGLFYTIDIIGQAIRKGKMIRFQHYTYNSKREKELRNNGEYYTLSPYSLIWNNDRYYLIGWAENRQAIREFRVDRMCVPKLLTTNAKPVPEDYDPDHYYRKSFKMYDGEHIEEIHLLCRNSMMNTLVDHFGKEFWFKPVDNEHFQATIEISVSNTFWGWLFQYVRECKLIGPDHIVSEYKERLNDAV